MVKTISFNGRNVALAAVALLAFAASVLSSGAGASPKPGGTTGDALEPGKQAAGQTTYPGDRRPVPRVVREWAAAWNSGSPERMSELFTKDGVYEDHAFGAEFRGRDGVAQWVSITTGAINDAHVEVHDAFRSGDRVAVRWTFSGTDSAGGLGGQPPTGKSFSVPAASIFEMKSEKSDKILRVDDYYNLADLLGQLGSPSDGTELPPAP